MWCFPVAAYTPKKVADTFEEAVDLCIDVARRELAENKENHG